MKAVFRAFNGMLQPADTDAVRVCARNAGKEVMVEVRRPRNIAHHKKFFALLNMLWEKTECGEIYPSREALRYAMIMAAGYFEVIPTKRGPKEVPKSISFEKMDQAEFEELYEACIGLVVKEILPNVTRDELVEELLEFM